ncbi:hypothetical protein E4U43_003552 [Claviceps pusilla]|uniref:UBX domain-containing protein n=1 Tax=Claviceps pusilla TaxID=123648 RepID=A0A9P7SWP4_9HYPO|nr:hypothetical protein E4U43_003552 [Claviceps pusilla]
MGRDFSTFADFQKTLAQLGHHSGNVLIRLSFRRTDQTLYEAMEQISQSFLQEAESQDQAAPSGTDAAAAADTTKKDGEEDDSLTEELRRQDAPTTGGDKVTPEEMATAETASTLFEAPSANEDIALQNRTDAANDDPTCSASPEDPYQPVNVFLAPTGTTPAAALVPTSESDFTPTVAHAQLHQARLLQSSRNKRLSSDKELQDKAAAEEARIASIRSVLVKIRFPDNTSSEWQASPMATGSFLYQAVRHVMADASQKFHLLLPGSKTLIKDDTSQAHNLVKAYKFSSRMLVNLVWDDSVPASVRKQPFLRAHVAQKGQEVKVPDFEAQAQAQEDEQAPQTALVGQNGEADRGNRGGEGIKKVPKWLKLGKK